jgi:hypothetical protein
MRLDIDNVLLRVSDSQKAIKKSSFVDHELPHIDEDSLAGTKASREFMNYEGDSAVFWDRGIYYKENPKKLSTRVNHAKINQ